MVELLNFFYLLVKIRSMHVGLSGFLKNVGFLIRPAVRRAKANSALKPPIQIQLSYLPDKLSNSFPLLVKYLSMCEGCMNMKLVTFSCKG